MSTTALTAVGPAARISQLPRGLFQLFTCMVSIFIDIHHYFLDNVMWRKDNPDVSRHLFGRG